MNAIMKAERTHLAIGLSFIKETDITHAVLSFYGGGDEGGIEARYVVSAEMVDEDERLVNSPSSTKFIELSNALPDVPDEFYEAIEDLAEGLYQEYDWWNNDGGSGYICIDLTTFQYCVKYDLVGEDTGTPPVDENGDPDYDDYEETRPEWTEWGSGTIEI